MMSLPPNTTNALQRKCDCITQSLKNFHLHTVDAIYNGATG